MDRPSKRNSGAGALQGLTSYCLHLLTAVVGSMFVGAAAAVLGGIVWSATSRNADTQAIRWILLHRPFPLQLLGAFLLGALVAPRFTAASLARWTWVVPSVALSIALFSWKPYSTLTTETAWHHFFGVC